MVQNRLLAALATSLFALGLSSAAQAQLDAPPEPALPPAPNLMQPHQTPPKPGSYQSIVRAHRPSPEWTQDRSFTSTRFWLLDPGNFEVESWLRTDVPHELGGSRAPSELLWQQEVEIGLLPHLQIDLYENLTFNVEDDGVRRVQQEGNQIEARIAIPSYYGQLFSNPVIYVEWHPRHGAPDRVEARLLLGGAPTRWLFLAVNPYVETNVESTGVYSVGKDASGMATVVKSSRYLADLEFGATVALGFRITDWVRLSVETKIGADMFGDPQNRLHFVWLAGPGFIVKPLPPRYRQYFKIMGTILFAIPPTDPAAPEIEPLVILGSQL